MKKLFSVILTGMLILAIAVTTGCDRRSRGSLSEPASGVTSINGAVSMVLRDDYPYNEIYARIKDNNDNVITGLKLGNVHITEDGNPVVQIDLEAAMSPLAIILILDRSGSMDGQPTTSLNKAASGFVDSLSDRDYVEIIDFGDEVEISQSFTNDREKLKKVINEGTGNMPMTMLYDAIGVGIDEMQKMGGDRIIIAMSDGYDNSSKNYTTFQSIINYAISKNQKINTIGYGGAHDLDTIASDTGGLFIEAASGDELYEAYQRMVPVPVVDHVKVQFRSRDKEADGVTMYVIYGSLTCRFTGTYFQSD